MAHNRRENIDYVALNADRRPRRATRMGEGFDREDRQVAGRATTESPCRERAPTNPYRRLAPNPSKGTCVEQRRLVGTGDNSPQQKEVCLCHMHTTMCTEMQGPFVYSYHRTTVRTVVHDPYIFGQSVISCKLL